MATLTATKDGIKPFAKSSFRNRFKKQIENHVEEIVAILTIYTALKLTNGKADDFISY